MTDLLNAPRSAIDIITLGITIAHGLMDYYTAFRSQDTEIAKTTKKLSDLLALFRELHLQIEQRRKKKEKRTILATIESSMKDCEDIIEELNGELAKFRRESTHAVLARLRTTSQRLAYPFRRSTLQKLDEDINEILRRLSVGTNIVLYRDVARLQNGMDEVKALLRPMQAAQVSSDIKTWFEAPDAMINFNEAANKRHHNTGLWFVQSRIFETWKRSACSFLWLIGFAGSGKSILCSTAIQHTIQQRASRGTAVAFFFFTFNDQKKLEASSMLRTLILQLSGQLSKGNTILSRLKKSCHSTAPSNQALKDCLRHILRQFEATFIFLDGLDEIPRDQRRRDVLQALADLRSWSEPSLRIMISSRDEVDIRDSLCARSTEIIRMQNSSIDSDIANFISESLSCDSRLLHWKLHSDHIKNVLTKGAQGMFRWVDCQLDVLGRCPRSEHHLESVLGSLPQTLDETYERMLQRISRESLDEARRMLAILCCASRPLMVEELLEGMAVELGESPRFNSKRKLMDKDAIQDICPGLIEFDMDQKTKETTVRIAHFSVQEYLESERICSRTDVAVYGVVKELAHTEMVRICLTILLEPDLLQVEHIAEKSQAGIPSPRLAMAKYAAEHWPTHYKNCQQNTAVISQTSRLFADGNEHFKAWIALHNVDGCLSTPAPLYYASLLGLNAVVCNILASYPERIKTIGMKIIHTYLTRSRSNCRDQKHKTDCPDVDARSGHYGTALLAASAKGHDNIVQQLVAKGARLQEIGDSLYASALHAASDNGHKSTVVYLLETNTEATLQLNSSSLMTLWTANHSVIWLPMATALAIAAWGNCSEWSQLPFAAYITAVLCLTLTSVVFCGPLISKMWFVDHFINENVLSGKRSRIVDFEDKDRRTPLSFAAQNGHTEVAACLIERSADVNARDSYRRTPLSYAAEFEQAEMVKLLLRHGAAASLDLDRPDSSTICTEIGDTKNMTPLHYTVRFSDVDIAKVLLDSRVSINVAVHRRVWIRQFDKSGRITRKSEPLHAFRRDGTGLTPLHYAAWVGSKEMVSFFLRHGADPNAKSEYGETPLHLAVAKAIKGPENQPYEDYWTEDDWRVEVLLSIAWEEGESEELSSAHNAITRSRMSVLSALLADRRTRVDVTDIEGESAIHKLKYGAPGIAIYQFVKKLIQHDAQCMPRPVDKKTPLHLACEGGDFKSVRILASSAAHLAWCDRDGENALHLACKSGCKKSIKEVIRACQKHDVDLSSTKSFLGKNALHFYIESIFLQMETVQLLLNYGVDPSRRDSTGASALSLYKDLPLIVANPDMCKLLDVNRTDSP